MEALITLANLIYLLSYFVRDMLRLRLLTIVAAGILVAYFWTRSQPLMTVVYWNSFFILLNLLQALRIVLERRVGYDPLASAVAAARARLCAIFLLRSTPGNRCTVN